MVTIPFLDSHDDDLHERWETVLGHGTNLHLIIILNSFLFIYYYQIWHSSILLNKKSRSVHYLGQRPFTDSLKFISAYNLVSIIILP